MIKSMENTKQKDINVLPGFWHNKQQINLISINNIHKRFEETGRFDAIHQQWKEGEPNKPHVFFDSDVAKWIESAAYVLQNRKDAKLIELCDYYIDIIQLHQEAGGYFNSYFGHIDKANKWKKRVDHELYCAGHLIEAAVAYFEATGKPKFLDVVKKYADHIDKVFRQEKSAAFITPGHPEIELALYKLYLVTKDKKYLELSKFFIDERGQIQEEVYSAVDNRYDQSHKPVREQFEAEGHSVRALYLYSAMADIAKEYRDEKLMTACKKLFENITNKQMYITGGIGSSDYGEAFTYDYDLPNLTAYAETCAGIALIMFSDRMFGLDINSKYADIIERVLYNNVLSGVSLDGKSFFYENPLETDTKKWNFNQTLKIKQHLPIIERKEIFDCSCCPPNITRLIASVGGYIYKHMDNDIYINQYISNETVFAGTKILLKTEYPWEGKISINIDVTDGKEKHLYLRIPQWADKFDVSINGKFYDAKHNNGYIMLCVSSLIEIVFNIEMNVKYVFANPLVRSDNGRCAVQRGPIVYCAEQIDNETIILPDIKLDTKAKPIILDSVLTGKEIVLNADMRKQENLYSFDYPTFSKCQIKLIPYFARANCKITDMQVWFLY